MVVTHYKIFSISKLILLSDSKPYGIISCWWPISAMGLLHKWFVFLINLLKAVKKKQVESS